ncbi:parallel beta helix pectate lyase-like protein, partial [Rhizobium subbaraonis]
MAVQYHTHVFEIPTATPDDVAEGTSSEIAVTPESLAPTVETVRTAVQPYPSVADMAGIGIPASTDSLTVDGYQVAGDGGGALYAKVESEPSHAAKFQTADGAWWGLVDTIRIDARWLGVKANGIVDDRVAAQNAIDFASALGGGVVLFPRGTIMLGGVGLSVPSNVTIQGAGKGITIFKRIAGAAMHVISCQTFAENVQILDLTVDGNKQADPQGVMAGYHGIRGAGTKGLTIERVHVKNAIYYGIGLQGIENLEYDVRITDCDIEANGGWSTSSPTSGDGIDIKSANRVWLTRVRSWNNAQKGFDPRAYLLDITDCHAEGNGNAGFHLRGRGDLATNIKGVITVKGGSAVGNGVNGVVVSQDNPLLPLDVSITGFDAIGNTSQGIFINHELISASIVGSLVRDNTGAGVRSIAAEVTFTGNRLMNNGTYGFDGAAQNNRNIVSGNICLG